MTQAEVVVVGAGIAGVSTAYFLGRHGITDVVLVDPRPPLTLTSDKSTECYRNWWPDASMVGLMNRSIDLIAELDREAGVGLNQRGYLYVTASEETLDRFRDQVDATRAMGAPADVLDSDQLNSEYPFVTDSAVGAIRANRAGWFSAQQLGRWMFDRTLESGGSLVRQSVVGISPGVVTLDDGSTIETEQIILAAGPMSTTVARLSGIELPLHSELHLKVTFRDHLGIVPRDAPMTIWADPQRIKWADDERDALVERGREGLLGVLAGSCHFRPEGGADSSYVVALWEYETKIAEPAWPLPLDDLYPEVVLRGLEAMVPGLGEYRDRLPHSSVDGGYYTKTGENRPLIGPSPIEGVHLICGFSGFGVMVAAGAADLLACHISGSDLPDYAGDFLLSRYDDPMYLQRMATTDSGQI